MKLIPLLALFAVVCHSFSLFSSSTPKQYAEGEAINIKANGLTSVKTQTPYDLYHIPYPKPEVVESKKSATVDIFNMKHIQNSVYDIKVLKDQTCVVAGDLYLGPNDIDLYTSLITGEYLVHFMLDNLPAVMKIQSLGGTTFFENGSPLGGAVINSQDNSVAGMALNNHLDFTVFYNKGKDSKVEIVGFEVTPRSLHHQSSTDFNDAAVKTGTLNSCSIGNLPVHILKNSNGDNNSSIRTIFTYSIRWVQSETKWADRFSVFLAHNPSHQNAKIHWFSIVNSLLIFVFLTGLVGLILLRTLYQDFAQYSRVAMDEESDADHEESGWKMVYADVFRPPETAVYLFTSTIGTGCQLVTVLFLSLLLSLFGVSTPETEGSSFSTILIIFILCGYLNGYISSRFYKTFNGDRFKTNFLFTTFFYPSVIFLCLFSLNTLLYYVGSSGYVPFSTFFYILSIWLFINLPLTFFGAYKGYKKDPIEAPVATSGVPREIPPQPWYLRCGILYPICGVIPFGIVFVELYFFLSSIWMGSYYYMFGFLFIIFCLLVLTTAELSIIITYSLLCSENYHWWWNSILASGFSAIYVFVFSVYYFFTTFTMTSLIAIVKCLGFITLFSISFFLVTGFVGFIASFIFVMAIFGAVKVD